MIITIIRTVILYMLAVIAVRIMGKRQVGELQPMEFIVTILLSEIVAIPMQNNNIPLLNSVISVLVLTSLAIILSFTSLKSMRLRNILEGKPQVVITNGRPDNEQLKKLRLTLDDVLGALRQKNIFSISEVKYAILETNGSLSVMLNSENKGVTPKDLKLKVKEAELECPVIIDGKESDLFFNQCSMDNKKLNKLLQDKGLNIETVYLLTIDKLGNMVLIERDDIK